MSDCTATKHGTATAYQAYGCRCAEAREAQRRYKKRWAMDRARGADRKIDATGTRRRMQALMRIGWPSHAIMARLGYSDGGNWILYADRIHVDTARRVTALYDELWDIPGTSKWTRTWATNQGFPPPMAWDDDMIDDPHCQPFVKKNVPDLHPDHDDIDEVAVERFITGDLHWQSLSRSERIAAALRMDRAGVSRNVIAARTRLNSATLWAAFRTADASDSEETIVS